jgi:predicted RNA-binding Zn-ribbon protein involved in translation (DUF1610 family)
MPKHKPKHTCPECGFVAMSAGYLVRHLRAHVVFGCPLCKYETTNRQHQVEHTRTHTGEKPFSCPHCDFTTALKGNLTNHSVIHTGYKPFVCTLCDYSAAAQCTIRKHFRTHTGEKPFSCDLCGLKTAYKSNLTKHFAKMHGGVPVQYTGPATETEQLASAAAKFARSRAAKPRAKAKVIRSKAPSRAGTAPSPTTKSGPPRVRAAQPVPQQPVRCVVTKVDVADLANAITAARLETPRGIKSSTMTNVHRRRDRSSRSVARSDVAAAARVAAERIAVGFAQLPVNRAAVAAVSSHERVPHPEPNPDLTRGAVVTLNATVCATSRTFRRLVYPRGQTHAVIARYTTAVGLVRLFVLKEHADGTYPRTLDVNGHTLATVLAPPDTVVDSRAPFPEHLPSLPHDVMVAVSKRYCVHGRFLD